MPKYAVEVRVMPRPALLDPQGQAVAHALEALGFNQVHDVRVGKALRLVLERPSREAAETAVRDMCQRLLANPVTEDFTFTLEATK